MALSIRSLAEPDFDTADALLQSAFGGPESRLPDLRLYYEAEPGGLWLAVRDGQPAGMVGAVNYSTVAHVGFMVVQRSAQRQGIGMALMRHILSTLQGQGVPVATLDASPAGYPMYLKLGFVDYDSTCIFHCERPPRRERPPEVQPIAAADLAALAASDSQVFGADRGRVLRALLNAFPARAFVLRAEAGRILGHVFAQANRIGPWVAGNSAHAEALLRAALSVPYAGPVSLTVPGLNPAAAELLVRYGFDMARANRHMGRGASEPPSQRWQIYGQTSQFFG